VTPLRLIIIGVLLYILIKLLTGSGRQKVHGKKRGAGTATGPIQDVLVEDPVCHTYIPKGQAVRLHHNKQILYFCSNKCCETFLKNKGAEE